MKTSYGNDYSAYHLVEVGRRVLDRDLNRAVNVFFNEVGDRSGDGID